MTAFVAPHPHRPARSSRHRVTASAPGTTASRAPRRRGGAAVEPLESRVLLTAAPGVFDAAFGVDGRVRLDVDGLADRAEWVRGLPGGMALVFGTSTHAVTVQPPAGSDPSAQPVIRNETERFLARLKADGSLDLGFGDAGIVRLPDPGGDLNPPVVQSDGKILIAGSLTFGDQRSVTFTVGPGGTTAENSALAASGTNAGFALSRLNADGSIDTGFGDHGRASVSLYASITMLPGARSTSLALQPDGKIVAAGVVEKPAGVVAGPALSAFSLVRFNADGTLDETFGRRLEDVNVQVTTLAVDRDGRIVVGASPARPTPSADLTPTDAGGFTLFRYNPDGSADGSFGQGGRARVPVRTAAAAVDQVKLTDLLLQPDGKYTAVGSVGASDFGVARFNADGTPDATFDADGLVVGRGVQVSFEGERVGQYRLRYDASDGAVYVVGVGTGAESVAAPDAHAPAARAKGLQVFSAGFAPGGGLVSPGRAVDLPMSGAEWVGAAAVQDDGRILGVGKAFPAADAGEGLAYAQSADALVVRFDPAALPPVSDLPAFTYPPTPATGGASYYDNAGPSGDVIVGTNGATATDSLSVAFSGRTMVRGGRAYPFRITYPNEALARQTPVTVTGPGGFSGAAQALKVKAMGRPRRAAGATPTPPQARAAVASYRLPASRGGSGLTALGSYAVRLNATAGQAASGQIVGMFTVNGRPAPAPLVVVSSWPVENGKAALTGVVRNTSSVAGNTTGWVIDRLDAAGAGQFIDVDVDTGAFAGRAALLNGRRIKLIGTVQQQYRPGRGSISVLVVESITSAT